MDGPPRDEAARIAQALSAPPVAWHEITRLEDLSDAHRPPLGPGERLLQVRCTCNPLLQSRPVERTKQIDVMELLRARGLRMTPQRRAIVGAVMHAQGHISPTVITRKIQSEMPGVNASTVYRTLTLLEEVGVLQHSHLESGPEYHRTEEAEHIHLVCGSCGGDDPLSLPEAESLQELIRRHHGFEADLTHFAITGLCATCDASQN